MGDLEDLITVAPIFLLMGGVLIAGYLAPYVLCMFDELGERALKHKQTHA